MSTATRKMINCRHAIEEHGHADMPELRKRLRGALIDEPAEAHA